MAERKTRISAALREAVRLMAEDGLTRSESAEKVGLTDHALYCALRKPHVRSLRNELLAGVRQSLATRAWKKVETIMDTAKSPAVQLDACQYAIDAAGEGPVQRQHVQHEHVGGIVPGLTVILKSWEPHTIEGDLSPMINGKPAVRMIGTPKEHPAVAAERQRLIASLPKPVPHPSMAGKDQK